MDNVLIVDSNPELLCYFEEGLRKYKSQFEVLTAAQRKDALKVLKKEPVSVLVTDLVMPKTEEPELLDYMTRKHPKVSCIVMKGSDSFEIKQSAKINDIFRYIEKPVDFNELAWAILDGLDRFDEGDLAYMENPKLNGEATVLEKAFKTKEPGGQNRAGFSQNQVKSKKLLSQAINFAEGNHFQQGKKALSFFLLNNRHSCEGWLWYSRIVGSMKAIESSLKNAQRISPQHAEVLSEIEKFKLADKMMEGESFGRCPFCWSPVKETAVECRYCKSHLFIHEKLFTAPQSTRRDVMEKAIERYTKVIGREKNIHAHYYLGLAHINLGHWKEALDQLYETEKIAPQNKFFSNRLYSLLNYMAGRKSVPERKVSVRESGAHPSAEPQTKVKKNKILVVDDSSTTRKVVSIALVKNGYEVLEAKNGLEALAMLNDRRPDLVLLDIIMPGMDGYETLSIIKRSEEFKHIPIIMLTSRDKLFDKLRGKISASDEYLTKPFAPDELVTIINKYLRVDL